jgi:hypothetical protein
MAPVSKRSIRSINRQHFALSPIPDYANKRLDEQVELISKVVLENPLKAIHEVWTALDPVAHSIILSELKLLNGKVRTQHLKRTREDAAELRKHTRMLRTFLEKQVDHENIVARRPRLYIPRLYNVEPEGTGTLRKVLEIEERHLKWSVAQINLSLKKHSKWDARGMIRAQEYVIRRVDFFGIPGGIQLSSGAIADLYELTRNPEEEVDDSDTAVSIRKAIDYYRGKPENAYFVQNIEFYLEDWKKPT